MHLLKLNERGFSLSHAVFQLFVFMIFVQIITLMIMLYNRHFNLKLIHEEVEWNFFIADLNFMFDRVRNVETKYRGYQIAFYEPEGTTTVNYFIEARGFSIVRSTDLGGNEILLRNSRQINSVIQDGVLNVKVTMQTDEVKERSFANAVPKQ